jgi:hypothetical protein
MSVNVPPMSIASDSPLIPLLETVVVLISSDDRIKRA